MRQPLKRFPKEQEEEPWQALLRFVYPYATHFVFPEGLMKAMLPVGADLLVKLAFQSAKQHPQECEAAREDIDHRITVSIRHWTDPAAFYLLLQWLW